MELNLSKRSKRESITVGGVEVQPGRQATIDLPITDLSTHTPVTMPVQVVHGRTDGPRLFVCAAIHGDEINGVEIIRRLLRLSTLRQLRGTLIAVPIVNVLGFVFQSRYLPDRRDLNRSFPGSVGGSVAGRLARLFVDEVVSKSTHGIDLHTGAIHRDNFPQIRGDLDNPETEKLALAFGVPVVINTGFREGSLREAAARNNVPVIVYEAGEALRFNEACIRAGVKGIVRVMRALEMLPVAPPRRKKVASKPLVIGSSRWIRAPQSGLFRATKALGSQVKAGEALGAIANPFGDNEKTIHCTVDGIVIGRSNLPLVHEGDALFHVACHQGTKVVARSLDAFEPEADYETGTTAELTDELPIV
ncbi:succinylglutamate desuccinylase/aspartoacylase family protein [Algihabitans albus]|uniref:succinylglutamate desuccinylase/aspartoacylase family protein n=1 Tax=Algihabitans albus TaxID=2164067 RepID=UPI000E5CBFD9|nr:succinylglutamate desuccinylase/aspartoacylase family protein [Algihabitans albus]